MRSSRAIVLISAFVLFAKAAASHSHVDSVARDSSYLSLAEEYGPVIYQKTRSVVLDALTRFDYDGDWNGANKRVAWRLQFKSNGRQPSVQIEPESHGVFGFIDTTFAFSPLQPGVVYEYEPGTYAAETPQPMQKGVGNRLLSIEDELWGKRYQIGSQEIFCCVEPYQTADGQVIKFGASFNGPWGGCAAKPPWGWHDPTDLRMRMGDWFRNPAFTFVSHLTLPKLPGEYVHNPYLIKVLASESDLLDCHNQESKSETLKQSTLETALRIAQILLGKGDSTLGSRARGLFLEDMHLLEWAGSCGYQFWAQVVAGGAEKALSLLKRNSSEYVALPTGSDMTLLGPRIAAPRRFYQSIILGYQAARPGELTIQWLDDSSEEFTADRSSVLSLPQNQDWSQVSVPLSEFKDLKGNTPIRRLRLKFKLPPIAGQKEPYLLDWMVLDRGPIADLLR